MNSLRKGIATVEAAVALPIVIMIMMSAIEVSDGLHQQHRARVVLHECSKFAANGSTTSAQVRDHAQALLSGFGVTSFDISLEVVPRTVNVGSTDPPTTTSFTINSSGTATSGLEDVPRGTLLRMTLHVPRSSILGVHRLLGSQADCSCVFAKEH